MKQRSATFICNVHVAVNVKWKRLENLTSCWYLLESTSGIKWWMSNELETMSKQLVIAWGLYFVFFG